MDILNASQTPASRGTVQTGSAAVLSRKASGQRLKLRVRPCGGRLLPHPPEPFHREFALAQKVPPFLFLLRFWQ